MKIIKIVKVNILIVLFFYMLSLPVYAMNTGLEIENLSISEQNEFISNINLKLCDEPVSKRAIYCFDVSDKESIALGFRETVSGRIDIYNSDGIFQYGYSFADSGSFGVEWDAENIIIYFVTSDIVALIDKNENILEVRRVVNNEKNNTYMYDVIFNKNKNVGDNQYFAKNQLGIFNFFFTSSFSQLIKVKGDGSEKILYDVSNLFNLKVLFGFIAIIAFIILVITVIIRKTIHINK